MLYPIAYPGLRELRSVSIPSVKLGRRVLIPREKFLKIFDPAGWP